MSARKLYENSTPLPDPRSGLVLDDFMLGLSSRLALSCLGKILSPPGVSAKKEPVYGRFSEICSWKLLGRLVWNVAFSPRAPS